MPTAGVFKPLSLLAIAVVVAVSGCQTMNLFGRNPQADPPEYRTLSHRPDRKIVQLTNGLVVIVQRISTSPVVSVQCYVKTGSIYEGKYNGAGLSHFLEHLCASGSTTTHTEAESHKILGEIGAQTNASTSLDNVRYYINTSAEHADQAIDLISDWMQHTKIGEAEYTRERDVIQREFAMGEGEPGRIFWKLTQQARYRFHPARQPTIGYLDEFLKITREQITDFYHQMYVPNNMVFVVAGDVDVQKTIDHVTQQWKDAKARKLPGIVFPVEPPIEHPREMTGYADIDRPRLRLAWPGTRLGQDHDYALDLLGQVLGQGELSRLVQEVRNKQQLVTSIVAYNNSFSWGEGFFGIDAVVQKDKMDAAKQAILDQVTRIETFGITADELQRAKNKTIAHAVYATQTAQDAAERVADDFISTGDPDYLQHYTEAIQKVSMREVLAAANEYLKPERLITVKLLPAQGKLQPLTRPPEPAQTNVRNPQVELVDLDNGALVAKLEKIKSQAPVEKQVVVNPIQLHRLPNGLRVLIQRDTRLPLVAMQFYQLGGLLSDTAGHEGLANATALMQMRGTVDHDADEIATILEDRGAMLASDCGNSTSYMSGLSLSKDWPTILNLMSDVVQRPSFPQSEWDKLRPRLLAAIDSQNDQWYTQLRMAFRQAYFGDHPWSQSVEGRRSEVEKITPDGMQKFHFDHVGADQSVLAIFGDVDEAQALAEAQKLFGSLPAKAPVAFVVKEPKPQTGRIVQVKTVKPTPAVQIGYGPGLQRTSPDYPALLVMNRVLSSFPVGWFDQSLRGTHGGLVYAVGAGVFTGAARGYWAVLFNTGPHDVAKTVPQAMGRALEVVHRIRTQTVDDHTLADARTAVLVGEALGRQSAGDRAAIASLDELYGLGYDEPARFIQQIRHVTAKDVHGVADRYLGEPLAVVLTPVEIPAAELPSLHTAAAVPIKAAGKPAATPAKSAASK